MSDVKLLLALHAHQPVGNFDHVFAESCDKCYEPIIQALIKHERVKVSLHFSGPLLEWIEGNRPWIFEQLNHLVSRGQARMLGGAMWEPIFTSIPERNLIDQLKIMSDYVDVHFGAQPKGFWLTERVWDPDLPRIMAATGYEYTFIDDTHFRAAGVPIDMQHGYYMTDKAGEPLRIFPIDRGLRYAIPFHEADAVLKDLADKAQKTGARIFTYADDAEKFGVWPKTYEWVFEKGWLDRFFSLLADEAHGVSTGFFDDDLGLPTGRIYVPNASYDEMMEWAMPLEAQTQWDKAVEILEKLPEHEREIVKRFQRGGIWENYMVKYAEANQLRSRMIMVSRRLLDLNPGDRESFEIYKQLLRGQCNCPYWHGLFGGLYLNYLRAAIYHHLLDAEARYAEKNPSCRELIERADFDCDGGEEIILNGEKMAVIVKPVDGGTVCELDLSPLRLNFFDVLTRQREIYHQKLIEHAQSGQEGDEPKSIHDIVAVKEPGLEKKLIYDQYRRSSFRLAVYDSDYSAEQIERAETRDVSGLASGVYSAQDKIENGWLKVELSAESPGDDPVKLRALKELSFSSDEMRWETEVQIENVGGQAFEGLGDFSLNFTLLAGNHTSRRLGLFGEQVPADGEEGTENFTLSRRIDEPVGAGLRMWDDWFKHAFEIDTSGPCRIVTYPVETVTQSESGFERTYQGTAAHFLFELNVPPGQSRSFKLTFACIPYE